MATAIVRRSNSWCAKLIYRRARNAQKFSAAIIVYSRTQGTNLQQANAKATVFARAPVERRSNFGHVKNQEKWPGINWTIVTKSASAAPTTRRRKQRQETNQNKMCQENRTNRMI